ncbi:hypothetical protein CHS0354_031329 [Potamilus streckersoni]|uniref:Uncharacterized protein n=1 Tax=Potamilus streckersoni TaxID=2493646 RepID=A0AAE0WA85_9BIVA|nr:hypothetical protein CHS0354_031329 [Potamilus streckersoni]
MNNNSEVIATQVVGVSNDDITGHLAMDVVVCVRMIQLTMDVVVGVRMIQLTMTVGELHTTI